MPKPIVIYQRNRGRPYARKPRIPYWKYKLLKQATRLKRRYPSRQYRRLYIKRGSPVSVGLFGADAENASEEQKALRAALRVRGRGGYNFGKSMSRFTRGLGNIALSKLSNYQGGGLYTGRGDYVSNALVDGGRPTMEYTSGAGDNQEVIISHSEFIGDIYGPPSSAFNNQVYRLNPGMQDIFPWMSQVAINYEEYEFIQLIFMYRTTVDPSSTNNTSGNTGTLIMATNYNADDQPFLAKDQMMMYHGANSCRLTDDMSHGVECDPSKNAGSAMKRIRLFPLPPDEDINDYDLGQFQLAINNCPSAFQNQSIGELWVTYKVKLCKPKLGTGRGDGIQVATYLNNGGPTDTDMLWPTKVLGSTNYTYLGKALNSFDVSFNLGVTNGVGMTLPAWLSGTFELRMSFEGTTFAGTVTSITPAGNITDYNDLYATSNGSGDNPSSKSILISSTGLTLLYRFRVNPATGGVNNVITIVFGGTAATLTQSWVQIVEFNSRQAQSNSINNPAFYNYTTGALLYN